MISYIKHQKCEIIVRLCKLPYLVSRLFDFIQFEVFGQGFCCVRVPLACMQEGSPGVHQVRESKVANAGELMHE